jgi:ABC-type dipeptide/oligopeptide/nickel transport system permease subunit
MRWPIIVLGSILLLTIFAPVFGLHQPNHTQPDIQMQSPSFDHLFGTDFLGRDVLSRLLYGGQRTLIIAASAAILAILTGSSIGLAAGMAGSWLDAALSILINALLAIPNLLLGLMILTLLGAGGAPLIIATGFTQIAPVARVVRVATQSVLAQPYVEAGYAIGSRRWHILLNYVLPNILNIAVSYGTITLSYCLFNNAALSYLGLGGEPGVADWGVMLAEGRNILYDAPWVAIAPGLAITLTILSINSLFDQVTSIGKQD